MDTILIVSIVALLIGFSKGGMGAALAILATPLLSQVMPVADAIGLSLPLLLIADAFAIWMFWNTWDWRYIKLMLPPAVIGIAIGTALLVSLPDDVMRRVLGIFTLLFVIYKLVGNDYIVAHYRPRPWHAVIAGGVSGLGSALANTGAPPYTAYMLLQNLQPTIFVGTTTLFFALVNAIKLPGLILAGRFHIESILTVAWVIPLLPVGVWLGRWLVKRINALAFERFMLATLFVASMALLFIPPAR
jgi:uncharacterized membrane protein YfcA